MTEQKHRYLIITELFLPTKGGTAVWFDEVYRRIGGKEIHIVTADVPGGKEYDASHSNTVHRLSLKRHWWLKPESLGMYAKFFFKCLGLVINHKIDAIHAGRVLPEGLVGWLVARLSGKRIIIYAHGEEITTWRQSGKFKAMVFAYRRADKVVANSDFTRNELLKLGVLEDNIVLIHPGVDLNRFQPGLACEDLKRYIGLEPGQQLVLSVGRLSRRKGFDQVIRTLPLLLEQGQDVQYVIIGIGEDEEYLRSLAVENNVAQRVHMLGHVSAEDLPRWYNACDLFVMPNRDIDGDTEGFGMVFIEAGACEKAVIGGKDGGAGSAIKDGVTGVLVDGSDLPEISGSISALLSNERVRDRLGEDGLRRVRKELGWDQTSKKTIGL